MSKIVYKRVIGDGDEIFTVELFILIHFSSNSFEIFTNSTLEGLLISINEEMEYTHAMIVRGNDGGVLLTFLGYNLDFS